MIQEKVQQEVTTIPTPSTGKVKDEYEKNKDKYATPATRDLNLVFNASKAKIEAAKADLDSGESWASVAKKYSQDSVSKQNGGKFPGVTKGQFPKELDKAVFSAQKSQIVGPIKTQYGYYVFEVTKSTAGKQQSLAQASEQIRSQIQQEAQQKAQTNFQTEFTDKWRKKTKCAEDFKVPAVCGNTPEPKKDEKAATGQPAQ
jgi:foldase protein PrsA